MRINVGDLVRFSQYNPTHPNVDAIVTDVSGNLADLVDLQGNFLGGFDVFCLDKNPEVIWERASWREISKDHYEDALKQLEMGREIVYPVKEQNGKFYNLAPNLDAKIPEYKSFDAAGMDFYTPVSFTIEPRSQVCIDLGVIAQIPPGYYLRLESRSGHSLKLKVERGAGVIDHGYRDSIGVILYNHSDKPVHIIKGDRVCQGIIQRYERVKNTEGKVNRSVNRGGGFGSTNK